MAHPVCATQDPTRPQRASIPECTGAGTCQGARLVCAKVASAQSPIARALTTTLTASSCPPRSGRREGTREAENNDQLVAEPDVWLQPRQQRTRRRTADGSRTAQIASHGRLTACRSRLMRYPDRADDRRASLFLRRGALCILACVVQGILCSLCRFPYCSVRHTSTTLLERYDGTTVAGNANGQTETHTPGDHRHRVVCLMPQRCGHAGRAGSSTGTRAHARLLDSIISKAQRRIV
jgi:hypothetical protein